MTALGKVLYLLLGLHNAELSGREQTAGDELQTVILVLILHGQHLAYQHLNLMDKADEQQRVDDVEGGMEGRELVEVVASAQHVVDKPADGVAGRVEHNEKHHHTEDVEEHVGQGSTACLCVSRKRRHEGGDGGSNVLTHRQSCCLFEPEAGDVHTKEHQRDGHCGR